MPDMVFPSGCKVNSLTQPGYRAKDNKPSTSASLLLLYKHVLWKGSVYYRFHGRTTNRRHPIPAAPGFGIGFPAQYLSFPIVTPLGCGSGSILKHPLTTITDFELHLRF